MGVMQGPKYARVKIYDPVTGAGVVVRDDDRSEVFLQPGSLEGSIFRSSARDSESSSTSTTRAAGPSPSRSASAPTATEVSHAAGKRRPSPPMNQLGGTPPRRGTLPSV